MKSFLAVVLLAVVTLLSAPVSRAQAAPMEARVHLHNGKLSTADLSRVLLDNFHVKGFELDAGDSVQAGQVVARIVPAPIEPRQRAELVAQLDAALAATREAQAQAERAQSEYEQASRDRSRSEQLVASGVISREAFEQSQTKETTAKKALEAARERLDAAKAQEAAGKARLLEAERGGTSEAVVLVKSPLKGKVLRLLQQSERVVTPGTPLLDLGYSPQLEVVTDVLSTEAVKVHAGDPVLLEGWGGGKPIRARVRLVEPSGFTKISALGIEEQRVNVVIDFADPPGPLGDGYRVEARIIVWQADDVLKLPASALFRHGNAWSVFTVENGRARLREVQIGHRNASEAEVLGGIDAGRPVILHPTNEIREGIRVQSR